MGQQKKPNLPISEKMVLKNFLLHPSTIEKMERLIPQKKRAEFVRKTLDAALNLLEPKS